MATQQYAHWLNDIVTYWHCPNQGLRGSNSAHTSDCRSWDRSRKNGVTLQRVVLCREDEELVVASLRGDRLVDLREGDVDPKN